MLSATDVLARLRDQPARAAELAQVLIDAVLAAPVREFIEPARVVPALVAGLQAGVVHARPERLAAALAARQDRAVARPGPLAERLPPGLARVVQAALRRPFTPSRELVLRTILQTTILDFATRLRSAMPDTGWIPGAGIRSKLMGVAKGVASVVGAEVERQLEDRVRSFVDGALGRALDMIVERASDPRFAADMATWRGDAARSLLELPEAVVLTALLDELGQTTVGELLADTGLVAAWRAQLAGELEHHLGRLFVDPGFESWLGDLLDPASTR